MKTKILQKVVFMLLVLGISLSACKKGDAGPQGTKGDKGDLGAQGPKGNNGDLGAQGPKGNNGDVGAQGPKGDKGDTGPAGADGTTNVIYSDWITNTWQVQQQGGTSLVVDDIAAPKITQTVLDRGLVLVYIRTTPTSTVISQLPVTFYNTTNGTPIHIVEYELQIGQIGIFQSRRTYSGALDDNGTNTAFPNSQVRYIIIPGSQLATSSSSLKTASVESYDYNRVCAYYHIKP